MKSFQGEKLDHVELGSSSIVGDRAFALLDKETGKVVSVLESVSDITERKQTELERDSALKELRALKKKLEDGDVMPLKIDVEAFSTSVHQVIGCTGCHRDVAKGKHPSREPIESRRAYSLKHNQTCSQCHAARHMDYKDSVHANMVAAGEAGGILDTILLRLATFLEKNDALLAQEPANDEPVPNHIGRFEIKTRLMAVIG